MNQTLIVRTFTADEWQTYKDLRLASLAEAPFAFGSNFEEESQRADEYWQRRISLGAASEWELPMIAEVDGQPTGLSWGRIEPSEPDLATLYQVWVAPEFRRLGLGHMLMETFIAWARAKGVSILELGVTVGDSPARRLYERAGFEPTGDPQPFRPESDKMGQNMRRELIDSI